ncbi:hypothetical protein MYU51_011563 [Penicillium brevicompactum]
MASLAPDSTISSIAGTNAPETRVCQPAVANPTWTTAVVIDEAATEAPYGTMTGARSLWHWLSLHWVFYKVWMA